MLIWTTLQMLFQVSFLQPYNHLLGKGWPLGSLVCDVFWCFCHFPILCLGTGVVLDCIDSWSLPSSLLWSQHIPVQLTFCLYAVCFCAFDSSFLAETLFGSRSSVFILSILYRMVWNDLIFKGPRRVSYSICPNFVSLWLEFRIIVNCIFVL